MVFVRAKVIDATHLELLEPIAEDKGRTVMLAITESENILDEERCQWMELSASCLARAYGKDEPDYPVSMVKEKNTEYGQ